MYAHDLGEVACELLQPFSSLLVSFVSGRLVESHAAVLVVMGRAPLGASFTVLGVECIANVRCPVA